MRQVYNWVTHTLSNTVHNKTHTHTQHYLYLTSFVCGVDYDSADLHVAVIVLVRWP